MRVYPAALLVDGETHILKRPGTKPQPLCGVVLNREEDDLTTRRRDHLYRVSGGKRVTHLFRLMALLWLALAIEWASASEWGHATITALVGVGCYALGEHFRGKEVTHARG